MALPGFLGSAQGGVGEFLPQLFGKLTLGGTVGRKRLCSLIEPGGKGLH
jgi:hypothetical protein